MSRAETLPGGGGGHSCWVLGLSEFLALSSPCQPRTCRSLCWTSLCQPVKAAVPGLSAL